MGFEAFPERCDRGTVSYFEGKRVPKDWGVVTKRIREVFNLFMNSTVKSGGMKELKFRGTTPSVSGRSVGVN